MAVTSPEPRTIRGEESKALQLQPGPSQPGDRRPADKVNEETKAQININKLIDLLTFI